VIVGSGTSLLVVNTTLVNLKNSEIGFFGAQCSNLSKLPNVSFVIGSDEYVLASKNYVLKILNLE
jgi:hypothetical protein